MSNKEDRISRMENMPETFLLENNQGRIQDVFPWGVRSSGPLSIGGVLGLGASPKKI